MKFSGAIECIAKWCLIHSTSRPRFQKLSNRMTAHWSKKLDSFWSILRIQSPRRCKYLKNTECYVIQRKKCKQKKQIECVIGSVELH